jgi:hydroxymethylglutaryl-CoA lyase
MNLPDKVKICECWVRDGIQGEAQFIPTDRKIELINRMIEVGFKRIEVTSFAHPKLIPQFADGMEVLKGIRRPDDVCFVAIIPNDKALDRLMDACDKGYGVHEITAILSASEDHMLANLEKTFKEAMPPLADIVKRARKADIRVIGCIGTSFGCPLAGEVPLNKVIELTDWYLQQGATSIMLGDTTGEANPLQVREVYSEMRDRFPGVDFIAHFHDTRGMGLANTLAALQEGLVYHDSSFGGMGGQPATKRPKYHKGFAGNTCTEDMVLMMNEMGINTGLVLQEVLDLGLFIEETCGRELRGQVTRSGPVRHRSSSLLSISSLAGNKEIPPNLYFCGSESEKVSSGDKPAVVIRKALEKSWPLPEKLKMDLSGVAPKIELGERDILVTRFNVREVAEEKAALDVLSQKANGDVYLEGTIIIGFGDN